MSRFDNINPQVSDEFLEFAKEKTQHILDKLCNSFFIFEFYDDDAIEALEDCMIALVNYTFKDHDERVNCIDITTDEDIGVHGRIVYEIGCYNWIKPGQDYQTFEISFPLK